jgi:hypothetical protein
MALQKQILAILQLSVLSNARQGFMPIGNGKRNGDNRHLGWRVWNDTK